MLFHENSYLKENTTTVTGTVTVKDMTCITLQECIFYGQGGGQKGDRGTVTIDGNVYNVLHSYKGEDGNSVLQLDCEDPASLVGKEAVCALDWDYRYFQMKMHTALHMLHCVMEELHGDAIVYPSLSTVEDDFAVNKYKAAAVADIDFTAVEARMNELFSSDIPAETYADENNALYRYWKCMNWVIPCGGTHVKNLQEVGKVQLHTHTKKGNLSIQITPVL